jgi:hypothetical protein
MSHPQSLAAAMDADTSVEFDPPKEHNVVCHFKVGQRFSTRYICGNILHEELRERAVSHVSSIAPYICEIRVGLTVLYFN